MLRWLVAVVAFPIGGFLGHMIGGPAATVPAGIVSGLIAGGLIGLGQAVALGLRPQAIALWAAATAVGLGLALAAVTAVIGLIDTTPDAVFLGAVSGLALGTGQAVVLVRERVANAWIWVIGAGIAWAIGWFVTSGVGVALAAGWPVYGVSGAIASQLITGLVLWKVLPRGEASALATA
jgi:hypothetical protein